MKPTSQIAPPKDGVWAVDPALLPGAPKDATCLVHVLNGKAIAGVWVEKEHDDDALHAGAWEWWYKMLERSEATSHPDGGEPLARPAPRILELL